MARIISMISGNKYSFREYETFWKLKSYKLKSKRLKKKFLKDPSRYVPKFSVLGVLIGREILSTMNRPSFSRSLLSK